MPRPPRTLSRLAQLARYPILGLPAYLLVVLAVLIFFVDWCTGGRLSTTP